MDRYQPIYTKLENNIESDITRRNSRSMSRLCLLVFQFMTFHEKFIDHNKQKIKIESKYIYIAF